MLKKQCTHFCFTQLSYLIQVASIKISSVIYLHDHLKQLRKIRSGYAKNSINLYR